MSLHDATSVVTTAWARINAWLQANDQMGKLRLPPGVPSKEIAEAESILGLQFPPDVRASYELHNGRYGLWIFEEGFLLPLTRDPACPPTFQGNNVIDIWRLSLPNAEYDGERSQPQGPIKTDWWNKRWIPIIDNECGDDVCLDLDPPLGGTLGQVIDWGHEYGAIRVIAKSFAEYLSNHADALESGKYRIYDGGGGIELVEQEP